MRGLGHRQQRILDVLEKHQGGLAAENLLAAVIPSDSRVEEEKKRMRRALYGLEATGRVAIEPVRRISGRRVTAIASAVVVSVR